MMDFIYKLYESDNFTFYLTIALVILVILFVIVLIFGKKDQKLEETKRLEKISLEANTFKEKVKPAVPLEVEKPKEETPVLEEDKSASDAKVTIFMSEENKEDIPFKEAVEPVKLEEVSLDEINASLEKGIQEMENVKKEFDNIVIPDVTKEEKEEKKEEKPFQPSQVFSSVYVDNTKENDTEDDEFALPDLVSEPASDKEPAKPEFNLDNIENETYNIK